jgi:hypothetical protein
MWNEYIWLRMGTGGASSEHHNEFSGAIKNGEFLDQLGDYQLLKNDSIPRNLSQLQSSFQTKLMLRQPFLRIQFQGKH